jgi:hypothetical protein
MTSAVETRPIAPIPEQPATPQSQGPSSSLLPDPSASDLDAMSQLFALISDQRRDNLERGKGDVEALRDRKRDLQERMMTALKKAEADEDDAGVFGAFSGKFGTAAQIAAIAGAVALTVGTGGVVGALAIAGAALSAAAFTQSETRVLQRLGMDDETAGYVEIGLMAGGAACSGGSGAASLCGAGGAAAAATTVEKAAQIVGAAASIVAGASSATAAYTGWRAGEAEADALEHGADASDESAKQARLERMLLQLIDEIEDSERSDERTLGHLRGAIEAKGGALLMASARV